MGCTLKSVFIIIAETESRKKYEEEIFTFHDNYFRQSYPCFRGVDYIKDEFHAVIPQGHSECIYVSQSKMYLYYITMSGGRYFVISV